MFRPTLFNLVLAPLAVLAQTIVNGQIFTNGLAIVDAPQPKTTFHGGSNMPIAIDISGDGHLDQSASLPNSGKDTRFDLLQMYLVSYQTKLNLTVSEGTGLLQQEQGSAVKHLNYNISSCVPAGDYNLTVYEWSHINGTAHYTITPLPISIENPSQSGSCSGNQLEEQPQEASALSSSPWLTQNGTPITYPGVNSARSALSSTSAWAMLVAGAFVASLL